MRPQLSVMLPGQLAVSLALLFLLVLPRSSAATTNDGRAKILLHVRSVTTKNQCAGGVVANCGAAATAGGISAPGTGPFHFVYVLAAAGSGSLAGVQFGVDYQDSQPGDGFDGQGLDIFSWQQCATLEFPSDGATPWPAPGSGNTVTWNPENACQTGAVAVAGYFYVGAYAADSLRLTVRQETGQAKVANCSSAETPVYGPDLGFALFTNVGTNGCNPCLGDCPDFGFPRPVPPPPHLVVSPDSLQFTLNTASRPPATLTVSNTGGRPLTVQPTPGQSWVTVTPGSHLIAGGQSADFTVNVNSTGLSPGQYATTLILTSNDPMDSAHRVPVSMTLGPPILQLEPGLVEIVARVGTMSDVSEYLRNQGATTLNWTIDGLPTWLTVNPLSGTMAAGVLWTTIGLTANATSLPVGDYHDTLRVHTNDPLRSDQPLPIHLLIHEMDLALLVEPDTVDFVLPWRGGTASASVRIEQFGSDGGFTLSPSAPWLSVSRVRLDHGSYFSTAFSVDASSFPVGHFETVVPVSRGNETIDVQVRVDILPTPPDIDVTPAVATFEVAQGGGARTGTVLLRNKGYAPLTFQLAEVIPWCHPLEIVGSAGPGGSCVVPLVVDPTGVPVGTHDGILAILSNDPDQPRLNLPVRLIVRSAPLPVAVGGLVLAEMMTACASGDSLPQFIELRAVGAGETYRSTLGLRIEDAAGAVRYQGTAITASVPHGTHWPIGQTFLVTMAAYQSGGVPAPDAVVPLALDPIGGVITLFDGDPVSGLLQRFPYGTRGSFPAPEPGHALTRLPDGDYARLTLAAPVNRIGATGPGASCPCPPSRGRFGPLNVVFTTPSADSTYSYPSRFGVIGYEGTITYDLAVGASRVYGSGQSTYLTTIDPFTVRGLDTGTPMTFEARMRFAATSDVDYPRGAEFAEYSASLRTDGTPPIEIQKFITSRGWPPNFGVDSTLTVVVSTTTGRICPVETTISAGGGASLFAGTASVGPTGLSFRGLLPGVLLESCGGFEKATPLPVELAVISAEVENGHALLLWAGSSFFEPLFVDRRTAREEWKTVGRVSPDANGQYYFEDDDVRVGESYAWRLRGSSILTAETWLEIPGSGSPPLSLSARWDAGRGVVLARVAWPASGPADLSVHDITGRLVARRELVVDAAGPADVAIDSPPSLSSGIYFVRCRQGRSDARARVVVVD